MRALWIVMGKELIDAFRDRRMVLMAFLVMPLAVPSLLAGMSAVGMRKQMQKLEATLELYRDGRLEEVPAQRLLRQPAAVLEARARRLQECLARAKVACRVERVAGQVGGGTMPLAEPPSWACVLPTARAEWVQERLRASSPPVIARIAQEQLLLDVRCLHDEDLDTVAQALGALGNLT